MHFFSISECQSKTRSAATAAKGFTFAPNVEHVRKSIRKSYLDYLVSFPRKMAIAREVLKSIHSALIRQCNILSLVILWYHQPGIARPWYHQHIWRHFSDHVLLNTLLLTSTRSGIGHEVNSRGPSGFVATVAAGYFKSIRRKTPSTRDQKISCFFLAKPYLWFPAMINQLILLCCYL